MNSRTSESKVRFRRTGIPEREPIITGAAADKAKAAALVKYLGGTVGRIMCSSAETSR
jgi:hypothetical protein